MVPSAEGRSSADRERIVTLSAVVILEDGLLFAGSLLDQLLTALGSRALAVVYHDPPDRDDPLPASIRKHLTPMETLRMGALILSRRLQRIAPASMVPLGHQRLASVARRHRVSYTVLDDIQGESSREILAAYNADLFITSVETILKADFP